MTKGTGFVEERAEEPTLEAATSEMSYSFGVLEPGPRVYPHVQPNKHITSAFDNDP